MWNQKKKIAGLCIGLVVILALYLGLFTAKKPPFESRMVYSLSLGENEVIDVRNITAADFTGDGRKEILLSYDVADYVEEIVGGVTRHGVIFKEARMLILSTDELGNFQKSWEYDAGLTRQTVAVGDFDGDGKPDIVVGGFKIEDMENHSLITSRVEVLLRGENGDFDNVFSSNIPEFFGPGSIVTGDFDGDGRTNFIVSGMAKENESPYHAYLFRNENGENFTSSPIAVKKQTLVEDMWKADVDGDGSLDLIMRALDLDNETHSIILLLNDGQGEFEFRELNVSADLMSVGDFTGNGYPDIIYTRTGELRNEVYLLRNDRGEFAEAESTGVRSEERLAGVITSDFNNDNTPDILLLERHVKFREDLKRFETNIIGHLIMIEGAVGELSFTREWSYKFLEDNDIASKHAIAATDANNDGWIDLILVSREGEVYLALNQHA